MGLLSYQIYRPDPMLLSPARTLKSPVPELTHISRASRIETEPLDQLTSSGAYRAFCNQLGVTKVEKLEPR